jgi:hypothetical protein
MVAKSPAILIYVPSKTNKVHNFFILKKVYLFGMICVFSYLFNLKIFQAYDPAIPLLGIYPKECDSGYSRGTCTPMFIAALFTIAKLWK